MRAPMFDLPAYDKALRRAGSQCECPPGDCGAHKKERCTGAHRPGRPLVLTTDGDALCSGCADRKATTARKARERANAAAMVAATDALFAVEELRTADAPQELTPYVYELTYVGRDGETRESSGYVGGTSREDVLARIRAALPKPNGIAECRIREA